jgi:hypothetical protein
MHASDLARWTAVARHVCAEGCQLVLGAGGVSAGARLRFDLAGFPTVHGTVRWIVADRAGFVFDNPLCRDSQRALAGHGHIAEGVTLLPA